MFYVGTLRTDLNATHLRLKSFTSTLAICPVTVSHTSESALQPVNEVKDLGITLDSTLTLRTHINNICCSGSLSLHELSKIRKFLSQKDTKRVVHAFISSKLDYCNGLLYGSPSSEIQKLQRLQNAAARLINLHWLPIEHGVIFKLLL